MYNTANLHIGAWLQAAASGSNLLQMDGIASMILTVSVLLHDQPLTVVGDQEPERELVGREDGAIDHERAGHCGAEPAPQHGEPFLPDALPEAVDDAAVPRVRRRRLRLQPGLDHVQRVAADPAGDAREAPRHEHRGQGLLLRLPSPAARVQRLTRALVRPEVDAVRGRVPERGHGQATVDAAEALAPEDVPGHVQRPRRAPVRVQLQPDLDELYGGQDESLQRARADPGERHARVGGRV